MVKKRNKSRKRAVGETTLNIIGVLSGFGEVTTKSPFRTKRRKKR